MTLPTPQGEPEQPIADKTPWRLPRNQAERARLCIRAAEMRSKGKSYVMIAETLGMENPQAARKCAEVGYGLAPGDDLRTGRRRAADELDMLRREYWEIIDNPGYKVSAQGDVIRDPATGDPMPDQEARLGALRGLTEVNKQYRLLMGTDAPKLSASMVATGSLEEIRARIEETRRELEAAERDQGDDGLAGVPALPVPPPGAPPAPAHAGAPQEL